MIPSPFLWRRGWDSNPCAVARKLISSQICFVEVERNWSLYVEDERSYGSPKNKAFRASEDPKTPETLDISREFESLCILPDFALFSARWGELRENKCVVAPVVDQIER